jgi:flap endonuclease-1
MGLNLGDIVKATPRNIEDFRGKIVAVDAFNTLYQFLAIIRQPDGTPLMDRRGEVTSHLSGLLYRTSNLMQSGISPVFVFDGEPPKLKAKTIKDRAEVKQRAEREWKEALEEGDLQKARSKAMQTSRLTAEMVDQSKKLIGLMGLPIVQAPGEGEAQASAMAANGDVFAAASQDYDALLFGAPTLIRNLTITGRRKLPRKNIYIDVEPEQVELDFTLKDLGITREQLIDMGVLIGTDFNDGVRGIGPKKALNLIRECGTLERAMERLGIRIENATEIQQIFLEPPMTTDYSLQWRDTDVEGVKKLLCEEHDFSAERVAVALQKMSEAAMSRKQRSLDQWFR